MFVKSENNYVVKLPHGRVPEDWRRTVFGMLVGILIMVLVCLATGCACCDESWNRRESVYFYPSVSPKMLLRGPTEDMPNPEIFAYRSAWPAVAGDVDLGRVTYYQEYWYNRQSLAPNVPDYSYNLFRSYRSGATVR